MSTRSSKQVRFSAALYPRQRLRVSGTKHGSMTMNSSRPRRRQSLSRRSSRLERLTVGLKFEPSLKTPPFSVDDETRPCALVFVQGTGEERERRG
ncbi:hypothetical protein A9A89_1656 [Bifidobacterium psychraerophilum DSM 22366]|uniref:Uncharacterized protein n=1 Tax=Bifidobacterium psychraerophilum TaxID=218140 RepID=A0A087CCP6_9BIFI|nr:hypothetical protein BPSY_1454 [Bifidobacterium psychraerophilum]PKA95391.1 hypothetical protein A9A89_1656 [Bifidobacterium psychraerophilum DSM 22366]